MANRPEIAKGNILWSNGRGGWQPWKIVSETAFSWIVMQGTDPNPKDHWAITMKVCKRDLTAAVRQGYSRERFFTYQQKLECVWLGKWGNKVERRLNMKRDFAEFFAVAKMLGMTTDPEFKELALEAQDILRRL